MTPAVPTPTPECRHATAVAIGDIGVLLTGPSGVGKSDLALRLIDDGASLIADDQTVMTPSGGDILLSAPANIAGKLEVRGLGIVSLAWREPVPLGLIVRLGPPERIERLPEPEEEVIFGIPIPILSLDPFALSATAKLRLCVAGLAGHNPER